MGSGKGECDGGKEEKREEGKAVRAESKIEKQRNGGMREKVFREETESTDVEERDVRKKPPRLWNRLVILIFVLKGVGISIQHCLILCDYSSYTMVRTAK
jgi:hypothetical protein